jgi:hypothetical protein
MDSHVQPTGVLDILRQAMLSAGLQPLHSNCDNTFEMSVYLFYKQHSMAACCTCAAC